MLVDPMTSCGCFECIVAILPGTGGVMVVDRNYYGMTPSGMTFSTLAGVVGGGRQSPGFIGIGINYVVSKKFISADGGIKRIVWMPKELKEKLREQLEARANEAGVSDLLDKICTDENATDLGEVANFLAEKNHPALSMGEMF
jgi:acetyl-CoA synthase